MDTFSDKSCDRLFAATEAVLSTLNAWAKRGGGPWPYIPDLIGTAHEPVQMRGFTVAEAVEAVSFLRRMGFINLTETK